MGYFAGIDIGAILIALAVFFAILPFILIYISSYILGEAFALKFIPIALKLKGIKTVKLSRSAIAKYIIFMVTFTTLKMFIFLLLISPFGLYALSANILSALWPVIYAAFAIFAIFAYVNARLSMASVLFCNGNIGLIESLRRSWKLTSKRTLKIYLTSLMRWAVLFAFSCLLAYLIITSLNNRPLFEGSPIFPYLAIVFSILLALFSVWSSFLSVGIFSELIKGTDTKKIYQKTSS